MCKLLSSLCCYDWLSISVVLLIRVCFQNTIIFLIWNMYVCDFTVAYVFFNFVSAVVCSFLFSLSL